MALSAYRYEPQLPEVWCPPTAAEIYHGLECPECESPPEEHARCYGCRAFVACEGCDPETFADHGLKPCVRPFCPHMYCSTCQATNYITQQRQRVTHIIIQVAKTGVSALDLRQYENAENFKYDTCKMKGYCIPCYLACARCPRCLLCTIPPAATPSPSSEKAPCWYCTDGHKDSPPRKRAKKSA